MIVLSHGMAKSASSFVFQITHGLIHSHCRTAGGVVLDLKKYCLSSNGLFLNDAENIDEVIEKKIFEIGASNCDERNYLHIKIHRRCTPYVHQLIDEGKVIVISTYRDPRDIALSLIDAGRIDKERGKARFTQYETVTDTIDTVEYQLDCFNTWLNVKNIEFISFDQIATKPFDVGKRIAARLKIPYDESIVEELLINKSNIWEYNKGITNRWREEMEDSDIERFEKISAKFLDITKELSF